jgi:hypothetical protein
VPARSVPPDGRISIFAQAGADAASANVLVSNTKTIEMVLRRLRVVRGIVVDESGRPVAGAVVGVGGHSEQVLTTNEGSFALQFPTLGNASENDLIPLRVEKSGYVSSETYVSSEGLVTIVLPTVR